MWQELQQRLSGELYYDESVLHRAMRLSYATDASVYQEKPVAVAIPRNTNDLRELIVFAGQNKLSLIPRAAGTSLAGQVVGSGIVVDISKYFTAIGTVNETEQWVEVQPGVIRDDLNLFLKPYGLMFGPETSTANRAMIGGMIGNNSCGLHSIIWGDTRENIVEITCLLSDGSEAVFTELDEKGFAGKCLLKNMEGGIYRELHKLLDDPRTAAAINEGFPRASVHRRNTGYALDSLLQMYRNGKFNLCKLIAGSEGTLCFITSVKLKLRPLPPSHRCIVAVHTHTINESLRANIIALEHHCSASELVDDIILEYTRSNIEQSANRFFVEGAPRAILMVEFFAESTEALHQQSQLFIAKLQSLQLGYAWPVLFGVETDSAWNLRKAGLGLLRNEPGDTQPVNLIEDCAVDANDLPAYIEDLEQLLKKHNTRYSMYAHAGAG
ncbi:MAG TPA: FAD-binding oxidoreductase, partial [Chitinophagaceae bacterium]